MGEKRGDGRERDQGNGRRGKGEERREQGNLAFTPL